MNPSQNMNLKLASILELMSIVLLVSSSVCSPADGASMFCNELDIQKPPRFGKRDSLTRCVDHKRRLQDLTSPDGMLGHPLINSHEVTLDILRRIQNNADRPDFNYLAKLFSVPTKPMRHYQHNPQYPLDDLNR